MNESTTGNGAERSTAARKFPWRVRFAKWLLPRGYGVVYEFGWHDRRV